MYHLGYTILGSRLYSAVKVLSTLFGQWTLVYLYIALRQAFFLEKQGGLQKNTLFIVGAKNKEQNGIVPTMQNKETIIISVGGSLIVPDQLDTAFLKKLKAFITKEVHQGKKFVIIAGGGKTARTYQEAVKKVSDLTNDDLDWLGIHSTRLNGHLLRTLFRDIAHPTMVKDPNKTPSTDEHAVIIAAGWKPGCSTDYVAVLVAKKLRAKKLINLSNVDYVYDKDPRTHKDAEKIKKITWTSFRTLIPETWDPGLSSPFDPIAAKEAEKLGMEVAIIHGKKLTQVEKYLKGEKFVGTLIMQES